MEKSLRLNVVKRIREWVEKQDAAVKSQDVAVRNLGQQVRSLEEEISRLRGEVRAARRVDLVDFGELRAYMYMDDLAYRQLDGKYKGHTPSANSRDFSCPYRSERERYDNDAEPLLSLLFSHYWVEGLAFSYFDIGCQYGISALAAAQIVASARKTNQVYAFDPGAAGKLAPANILLNSMEGLVTFEPLAVSSGAFPGLVFTELGHSENNRLVNRTVGAEAASYVRMCTSMDEYIRSKGIPGDAIVKIDTQGGEVEVFQGMERTVASGYVTCLSEFVPDAISTRVPAAAWLKRLSDRFLLFEIRGIDLYLTPSHTVTPIADTAIDDFVEEVRGREVPYTDLLMVPRDIPGVENLRRRIEPAASHGAGAD